MKTGTPKVLSVIVGIPFIALMKGTARRMSSPIRATVIPAHMGARRTELAWSVSFQPDGLPASEAVALLEGALAANCLALKQLLER